MPPPAVGFTVTSLERSMGHVSIEPKKNTITSHVANLADKLPPKVIAKFAKLSDTEVGNLVRLQSVWRGYQERRPKRSMYHAVPRVDGATIEGEYEQKLSSREAALKISFDDPMFYLYAVRPNTKVATAVAGHRKIRDELIAIDNDLRSSSSLLRVPYQALIYQIQTGQWAHLSHLALQKQFPQGHEFHKLSPVRLLFYAHWKGDLSDSSFETGLNVYALLEDHALEIKPNYRDVHDPNPVSAIELPAKLTVSVLMEGKVLTQEGDAYLDRLAGC